MKQSPMLAHAPSTDQIQQAEHSPCHSRGSWKASAGRAALAPSGSATLALAGLRRMIAARSCVVISRPLLPDSLLTPTGQLSGTYIILIHFLARDDGGPGVMSAHAQGQR